MSTGGTVVFRLTDDLQTLATYLCMITGIVGWVYLGNPGAGAILDNGGWIGLQAWTGSLLLAAAMILLWARIATFGAGLRKKV